jgi:hypothetical protein
MRTIRICCLATNLHLALGVGNRGAARGSAAADL